MNVKAFVVAVCLSILSIWVYEAGYGKGYDEGYIQGGSDVVTIGGVFGP